MKVVLCIFLCLLVGSWAQPTRLGYNINDEYQFNYTTVVDSRGYVASTQSRTPGAFTTIYGTLVIQCTDQDSNSNLFAFNLFDNTFNVGQGTQQNYTSFNGGPLGETMYYQQNFTGEIVQIWYEDNDDPVLVNIRIGVINAFHSHLMGFGQSTKIYNDQDPVAVHNSLVSGKQSTVPDVSLEVHKSFTQNDVITFSDPTVKPWNVQFNSDQTLYVNQNGYILGAELNHFVTLVDIGSQQKTQEPATVQDGSDVPVNALMSSKGVLSIDGGAPVNNAASVQHWNLDKMTFEQLENSPRHNGASVFDMASYMIALKRNHIPLEQSLTKAVQALIFGSNTEQKISPAQQQKILKSLNNLASQNVEILKRVLLPTLHRFEQSKCKHIQRKMFHLLSSINSIFTQDLLIQYGLKSKDVETRLNAIYTVRNIAKPSSALIEIIMRMSLEDDNQIVRTISTLHFGILVKKLSLLEQDSASLFANDILNMIENNLNSGKDEQVITLLYSIVNAGKSSFCPKRLANIFKMTMRSENDKVKKATQSTIYKLHSYERNIVEDSNFPFNKSYVADFNAGGSVVGVDFSAELFAGTNFDCNQRWFNYEALADAKATLSLFGATHSLFEAEAIYGQANGAPLADELLLTVWGDVIYQQSIPEIDCLQHTYEIAHSAPGVSVDYIVWVAFVPIEFTAGASIDLNLSWEWKICATDLSVMAELIPVAHPTAYGSAEIDLYIIKAGIELNGDFAAVSIIPQAYIHGSECEVGFDVQLTTSAMDVDLISYYAWQDCVLWFFDCHWSQNDQQTWFSWTYPATDTVLFQQVWKIAN